MYVGGWGGAVCGGTATRIGIELAKALAKDLKDLAVNP